MTTTAPNLKTPFPYFGGKRRIAALVWECLGEVDNYAEPFAGGAAVLLGRPQAGKIETINDANHYVVNFWRSVQRAKAEVAEHADWPVTEADLHARHRYLVLSEAADKFREAIVRDPEYFDARFAGWWVWGQCCWIGGGWCDIDHRNLHSAQRPMFESQTGVHSAHLPEKHPMTVLGNSEQLPGVHGTHLSEQLPDLAGDGGATGRGVVSSAGQNRIPSAKSRGETAYENKRPRLASHDQPGTGVHLPQKHPALNSDFDKAGTGVVAKGPRIDSKGLGAGITAGRPQLGDEFDIGRGVNSNGAVRLCEQRRAWLLHWMESLADRLRLVRICYGHWSRICDSKTTMTRLGLTGVFLDPPYAKSLDRLQQWKQHLAGEGPAPEQTSDESNRSGGLYAQDGTQDVDRLVAEVNLWCQKWGANPKVRIAVCGYEGEHDDLEQLGWEVVAWKAHGGYGNRNSENQNKHRERIWFSPACLKDDTPQQQELFDAP